MNILKKEKKFKSIVEFSERYFTKINKIFNQLDLKQIKRFEQELLKLKKTNSTLFVFGNGGGAATAMTMSNDLGFDIMKKTKVKKTFKIISLNDNSSVLTAIGNDVGYENIFLNQLKIHFKKNDKILILSASGNSENLVKAAKWVKLKKGKILSIVGFDGGKIKRLSDTCIHIKTLKGEYGPVEDLQLIINHIFAHWFQIKFN